MTSALEQALARTYAGSGPMYMPNFAPSDFYTGNMAPPTSSGGMLAPSVPVPGANGSLLANKDQSRLPPNPLTWQDSPVSPAMAYVSAPPSPVAPTALAAASRVTLPAPVRPGIPVPQHPALSPQQIHAALMAQQTDGYRTDQSGRQVLAMNGHPARANPDVDQFGMVGGGSTTGTGKRG